MPPSSKYTDNSKSSATRLTEIEAHNPAQASQAQSLVKISAGKQPPTEEAVSNSLSSEDKVQALLSSTITNDSTVQLFVEDFNAIRDYCTRINRQLATAHQEICKYKMEMTTLKAANEASLDDRFASFSKLPVELRLKIWKHALFLPRVVGVKWIYRSGVRRHLGSIGQPSALRSVCREARGEAMKYQTYLAGRPTESRSFPGLYWILSPIFFNPAVDTIHLKNMERNIHGPTYIAALTILNTNTEEPIASYSIPASSWKLTSPIVHYLKNQLRANKVQELVVIVGSEHACTSVHPTLIKPRGMPIELVSLYILSDWVLDEGFTAYDRLPTITWEELEREADTVLRVPRKPSDSEPHFLKRVVFRELVAATDSTF